ncbi:MAG: hypothetical protein K9L56_14570 [Clostridiales bacterium]|nr:hypothetical protein [Clostridiales bacterium]
MTSNFKCYYHGNDLDGLASGALMRMKHPKAHMYPVDYGQPFPIDEINQYDVVAIVDFCPDDFDIIEEIIKRASIFWLIDHHVTTREKANKHNLKKRLKDPSVFITDSDEERYAACELVYMWMHNVGYDKVPYYLSLLGRYDVWDHSNPDTLPFQYAARAWFDDPRKDMQKWKKLFNENITANKQQLQGLVEKGRLIREYERKQNSQFANKECFEVEFEGYKAIAVNRPYTGSKFFDSVYDSKRHDLMISFGWNGKAWSLSFYSEKIDVSQIARKYGGGGHAGSAGFTTSELPGVFKDILL